MPNKDQYARRLIVNADDFGWDLDTCHATIDGFESGSITSATIMTGRPGTDLACEYAEANMDRFSFGLHFNIVDAHRPLFSMIGTLTDKNTRTFYNSDRQRINALFWRLSANELEQELLAQVGELTDRGVKISHVDSHGHLHKFPSVITAMKKVLQDRNIRWVRRPQNLYFAKSKVVTRLINGLSSPFFKGLATTDHFAAINRPVTDWVEKLISSMPAGDTELAVHPGYAEQWRNDEVRPLLDRRFTALLAENNIQLINFYNVSC